MWLLNLFEIHFDSKILVLVIANFLLNEPRDSRPGRASSRACRGSVSTKPALSIFSLVEMYKYLNQKCNISTLLTSGRQRDEEHLRQQLRVQERQNLRSRRSARLPGTLAL